MAAVRGRQHPTDTSLISSTTNPNTARYLQDNCGNGNWYTISKALLIRMNFGTPSSVLDSDFDLSYNIYPNPANRILTIQNAIKNNYDLNIKNTLGQIVVSENQLSEVEKTIDVSGLSSGFYTIEIKNKDKIFSEKLIIK